MITITLDNERIQRGDICILKLDPIPDDPHIDTTLSKPRPCLVLTKNHFGCTVIAFTTSKQYNFGIAIKCEVGTDRVSYPRYDQVTTVVDKKLSYTGINLLSQFPGIYNKIIDNLASYYKGDIEINSMILNQTQHNADPANNPVPKHHSTISDTPNPKPAQTCSNTIDPNSSSIKPSSADGNINDDTYIITNPHNKNSVSRFIDDRYTSAEGCTINSVEIYSKYTHYCNSRGVSPLGQKTFSMIMNNLGYKKLSLSSKQVYIGIEEKDKMIPIYTPPEEEEQKKTETEEEDLPEKNKRVYSLNKFIEIHDKYLKDSGKSLPKKIKSLEEEKGPKYLKNLLLTNSLVTASALLDMSLANISIMRKRYGVSSRTTT